MAINLLIIHTVLVNIHSCVMFWGWGNSNEEPISQDHDYEHWSTKVYSKNAWWYVNVERWCHLCEHYNNTFMSRTSQHAAHHIVSLPMAHSTEIILRFDWWGRAIGQHGLYWQTCTGIR